MTVTRQNVRQTQWRMTVNDWFACAGWCLLGAAVVWSVVVVVIRLLALHWPMEWIGLGLLGVVLAASWIWAVVRRVDELTAAAALDSAAGLKERVSSSLCCERMSDPFAQAVVQDAEAVSRRVSPRVFIRYRWPSSLSFATAAVLAAVIVVLLPIKPLLAKDDAKARQDKPLDVTSQEVKRAQKKMQDLREELEKNPALKDLKEQLKTVDQLPTEKLKTPESIRREEIKKIDQVADAIKQQQNEKQNTVRDLKQMFKGLKQTQQPKTPTEKLSQALARGDFKAAKDAVQELKEELAKLQDKEDVEKKKEIQKQLDNLSKKLEQAAQQQERKDELKKELEQSGVDKETAEKVLEQLTKQDMEKIKEQMKQKGADDQQIKEMMKKCQSCQQAGSRGGQMAQSMQKAAESMKDGESSDASEQLDQVSDQLNEMEQMQQQMNEMESTLSDLNEKKNETSNENKCQNCNGKGCEKCGGTGREGGTGGGKGRGGGTDPGQGRGGSLDEEETATGFKKERTPVVTNKGSIISKTYVDGEQVKGEVGQGEVDLTSASEREATDAINKSKIPSQYKSAVKKYYSGVRGPSSDKSSSGSEPKKSEKADSEKSDSEKTEPEPTKSNP